MRVDGSIPYYPVPTPTWEPSQGFPALTDAEALDYLASTALGDQDSNSQYVISNAMVTVLRTGRQITTYSGD
jgi:hypothetical protein